MRGEIRVAGRVGDLVFPMIFSPYSDMLIECDGGDYEEAFNCIGKFFVCCRVHFHGLGS